MNIQLVGEVAPGLEAWSWERIALYRNAYRGAERESIAGIILEPELKLAVSTNGHCLFAAHAPWIAAEVDKPCVVDKKAWLVRNTLEKTLGTPPTWQQALPDRYDYAVRFTLPASLENMCRVQDYRVLIDPSKKARVVIGDQFAVRKEWEALSNEDRALARILNADLMCNFAGREIHAMWKLPDAPPLDGSPVVFVQHYLDDFKPQDATKDHLLTPGRWPWFAVVMPIRP